jgi:hypothetical protein
VQECFGSFDPARSVNCSLDDEVFGLERPLNVNADGEFIYATSGYVGFPVIYQRPFECRHKENKESQASRV